MAARKRTWTPEIVRERIRTSMLVRRLTKHVLGQVEMSPTQVRAAEVLLKKRLPDLSAVEHSGEMRTREIVEYSRSELEAIASGVGEAPIH